MPTLTAYLLLMLELVSLISSCHAEVRLTLNSLTVDIHDAAMKDVLDDIHHQGDLNIVAFEETKIGNVRISKKFWNLPLEAGLDRLLSGWNYGISRDVSTGKITTLYLVSLRTDASVLPALQASSSNQQSSQDAYESQTQSSILSEPYDDPESSDPEDDEEYDEFATEPNFPSQEELENLPPDLREHLEKLYRNDNS